MDAFEKWLMSYYDKHGYFSDEEEMCEAFLAGKAEGIKEGMRRAAEIAEQHASVEGIAQRIRDAILKEAGE